MKRVILLVFAGAIVAGSAAASPQGGQMADLLYANSIYGLRHPLPDITPFALTGSEIKHKKASDLVVGVLGNAIIPGLGSTIIGDRYGVPIIIGYTLSAAVALTGFGIGALGALNDSGALPGTTTWFKVGVGGGIAAALFWIWGIYSPIHYVNHKDYSK